VPDVGQQRLTLLQSNEDSIYEQDILREPASIKPWLAYIEFKNKYGSLLEQAFVMERACSQLPRSYKLWKLVSRLALSVVLRVDALLTVIVSQFPDKTCRRSQPCYFCWRIPEGQLVVRESADFTEQDAADLGNVPQIPHAAATCHHNASSVRSGVARATHHPAQSDMGLLPTVCELGFRGDRGQDLAPVHASPPRGYRGLY
jgi:pre-mRNA-splicing factor SYF1